MRLRRDKDAITKLNNSKIIINTFPYILDSNTVIELAMGKGGMITRLALENPQKKFIGIDKEATIVLKAVAKAEKLELNNFLVICHNIFELPNLITGKIDQLWLTFPDPWPKNRHAKRRLINPQFLKIYRQILTKDGVFKFKTDNKKLFDEAVSNLLINKWKIIYQTTDLQQDVKNAQNVLTEYESRWIEQGKKINYLEAKI